MAFVRTKVLKRMKIHLTKFLLAASMLIGFTVAGFASERWETLRAINWVENPTNQTRVGRFGELGPYQFRPATWRMHTDKPFRLAVQRDEADQVAVMHYEWIKRSFEQAGVEVNPFNVALAWNSGVDAVLSGRSPSSSYHYAERVNNLVQTFMEGRPIIAEQKALPVEPALSIEQKPEQPVIESDSGLHFRVLQDTPRFVIAAG
jgi:hypothetical protein